MLTARATAVALALAVVPHAAAQLVLDSFDVGPAVVAAPDGDSDTAGFVQEPLDSDEVLSGRRGIGALAFAPAGGGTARIEIDPSGAGTAEVDLDPPATGTFFSQSAGISYVFDDDSIANGTLPLEGIDLTAGGTLDRLRIDVLDATNAGLQLDLRSVDGGGTQTTVQFNTRFAPGLTPLPAGVLEVPFSAFGGDAGPGDFDFTNVTVFQFDVTSANPVGSNASRDPTNLVLGSITVVPEPAAASLAALAGGMLLRRRRVV